MRNFNAPNLSAGCLTEIIYLSQLSSWQSRPRSERGFYYGKNFYDQSSPQIHLYFFEILRETEHYYFLFGRRVHKSLSSGAFKWTPEEAVYEAISRSRSHLSHQIARLNRACEFVRAGQMISSDFRDLIIAASAIEGAINTLEILGSPIQEHEDFELTY